MADQGGVSLGNYKGVMLCNRPVSGPAELTRAPMGDRPPFKAGVPLEPVNPRGYDPSLLEKLVRVWGWGGCQARGA